MLRREIWVSLGAGIAMLTAFRLGRAIAAVDKRRPSRSAHTYVLERSQMVSAPVDEVFAFFEKPANLGSITPAGMAFEILDIKNLAMQSGTRIEYRIRPLGIPQRWVTEIVEHEPGRAFVDVQTRGPYRYWRHQHTFEGSGHRTLMRDRVEYQMPFGPLGRIVHALLVAPQLRNIFDYRVEAVVRQFGARDDAEV